jgi:hypothetical protein
VLAAGTGAAEFFFFSGGWPRFTAASIAANRASFF